MAAEFEFKDMEARQMFKKLASGIQSIKNGEKKLIGLMSSVIFRDIIDHFNKEEGESGPWAPWSDVYAKHMEKIGRSGNKKLQFTGRLRNSFQPTNNRKSAEGYVWFNNAETKDHFPYAKAHNDGGEILPKRDFMWLSDKAAESLAQQLLNFALSEGVL